jgi:hypothetical protein
MQCCYARSYFVWAHLEQDRPRAKREANVARRYCDEANLICLAEQETHRESLAAIYLAIAVGGLVVTVTWITLLLYGA